MSKPGPAITPAGPIEDAPSLTRELERVEETNLRFYEAFTELDIDRMAGIWSPSPYTRCVHPGWELVVGWADIRQSWLEIFRSLEAIEFTLQDVHVEVSGNTAYVNLIAYVHIEPQDESPFMATVVTTNIWEKIDDDWRLMLHHSSNFSDDDDDEEEEDDDTGPLGFGGNGSGFGQAN